MSGSQLKTFEQSYKEKVKFGKLVYSNQVESLISNLLADKDYFTVQKSITTQKSLIDWKWILVLIASLLSIEWFVRKYYGKT